MEWWEDRGAVAQEEKRGVRRNFAKGAVSYDRHAAVQRHMADELLARTAAAAAGASRILEIGCGTGYLTALLHCANPQALLVAVDLDRALLSAARARLGPDAKTVWVMADGETLDRGNFDLIIANATFQWFVHPRQTLEGLKQALAPGGTLAFATLGPGTFRELAASLRRAADALGRPAPPIPASRFLDGQDWFNLLQDAGFRDLDLQDAAVTVAYPGVAQFLQSLKATGATNPRPRPFSPRLLAALTESYRQDFGENGAIPATYEIIWAAAKK